MDVDAEGNQLLRFLQFLQPGHVQLGGRQHRRNQSQELLFFENADYIRAVRFIGDMPQFLEQRLGRDASLQLRLACIVVLHLGALFDVVSQPHLEAQQPEQPDRIVVQSIVADRAQLFALQVADAIIRIEQQPARGRVQRERDGINREVAPAQIFMNGGRTDHRFGARLRKFLLARHPNSGVHAAGEKHLGDFAVFVGPQYFGSDFLGDGFGQLGGISFHREVDLLDREAAQHVAHGPAREKNVHVGMDRGGLDFGNHAALIRAQVAVEHIHVIAHRFALFRPSDDARLRFSAAGTA